MGKIVHDETSNNESDHVMMGESAWITVGSISVYIYRRDDDGVVFVDLYPLGGAMEAPIDSCRASFEEGN